MRPLAAWPVLGAVLAVGCGQQPVVLPTRDLDRPTDFAFTCVQIATINDQRMLTARPMSVCHPPGQSNPMVDLSDLAGRAQGTFGLLTNSGHDELAVVDLDNDRLVDLDPQNFGFDMLPVGTQPEVVASTTDGCAAVTVNRGSCDLTVVDTTQLLTPLFPGAIATTAASAQVLAANVTLTTASGTALRGRVGEIALLPQTDVPADHMCTGANASAPGPAPWHAVVTVPSCGLVALVDLPSGRITSAVSMTTKGLSDAGPDPVCPVECGAAAVQPTVGVLAEALALTPDGGRVYVGGAGAPYVGALAIAGTSDAPVFQIPPGAGAIPLHENAGGTTRLRLSVDQHGAFVGRRGEFLYAAASDGSVRIVDVTQRANNGERECDANVDPLWVANTGKPTTQGCFVVPDGPADAPVQRLPLAQGPGLRLPLLPSAPDQPRPVVIDMSFVSMIPQNDGITDPQTLEDRIDGAFALLLSSTGAIHYVNIDPALPVDALTHTFRDFGHVDDYVKYATRGVPRVLVAPSVTFSTNNVPFASASAVGFNANPTLETVTVRQADAPALVPWASAGTTVALWASFPRRSEATPQTWAVRWEDILPDTSRAAGSLMASSTAGQVGKLLDLGADFCASGVRPGDIVQLLGCTADNQCGLDGTSVCMGATSTEPGLCFPASIVRANQGHLPDACARHLVSRRRYQVASAAKTELALAPLLDEVPKPSIRRCTVDADCNVQGTLGFASFKCLAVDEGPPRCVQPCARTTDCRAGFLCEAGNAGPAGGSYCTEAPSSDLDTCWPQTTPYVIRAGRSFLVSGSYVEKFVTSTEVSGVCQDNASRDSTLVRRIPLDSPHCSNVADGAASLAVLTGTDPPAASTGWGNPCLFAAPNAGDETVAGVPPLVHVKALFQNPELRFLLTNLENWAGEGLALSFSVTGGFTPLTSVSSNQPVAVPSRLVTGPVTIIVPNPFDPPSAADLDPQRRLFPYVYMVDVGRTGSSGARGQVLRFNPRTAAFDSALSTPAFLIQ